MDLQGSLHLESLFKSKTQDKIQKGIALQEEADEQTANVSYSDGALHLICLRLEVMVKYCWPEG